MNAVTRDVERNRAWQERVVVTTTFDRAQNVERSQVRLQQGVPGSGKNLDRRSKDVIAAAVPRIEPVHQDVDELRDILRRSSVHDVQIVRRDRCTLSDGSEESNDDELNVARRERRQQSF